jgi:hypothetical protein
MSLTIATVLKLGGPYDVSYVNHIANSINEHVSIPYEFVCLTDETAGFSTNVHKIIGFEHNWPKWWGKIELFKPDKFFTDRIFYLDLDTIILNNIDDIVSYDGNFCGLQDFNNLNGLGSGIMAWGCNSPNLNAIYANFMRNPTYNMTNHRYGDQEFIYRFVKRSMDGIQKLYPDRIISYKKHCINNRGNELIIPDDASIIYFHGKPRPRDVTESEITQHWKG